MKPYKILKYSATGCTTEQIQDYKLEIQYLLTSKLVQDRRREPNEKCVATMKEIGGVK